jgi:uncharacterized protein (DUF983 family)
MEPGRRIVADAAVHWSTGIGRGLRGRCPACGQGRLFGAFLKVVDSCDACGTEMHHHRADDLPPYLVIAVAGKIIGFGVYWTEMSDHPPPALVSLGVWLAVALVACLALIQPVKGAVVGLQYALGMHGFGEPAPIGPAIDRETGLDRRDRADPRRPAHLDGA